MTHALVIRMDRMGDVLLSGPAVRAVASGADRVSYLCSPAGAGAAGMLPGVDQTVVARAGWIEGEAPPVRREDTNAFIDEIERLEVDEALILTSFHQSPLPMALLLRLAGVPRIGAISVDYPGSLLDVRHLVDDDIHEVERALSLVTAMGYPLPPDDDGSLQIRRAPRAGPDAVPAARPQPSIVVHPGASVSARAWHEQGNAAVARLLASAGWDVVVTGGADDRALTAQVAGDWAADLGGCLTLPDLVEVIASAHAIVVGNTGPAHIAAAVGTPVVSLYAPTVPAVRWRPWMVPHVLLGDQGIECAGCRARECPIPGHPCIGELDPEDVAAAADALASAHVRETVASA